MENLNSFNEEKKVKIAQKRIIINKTIFFFKIKKVCECVSVNVCQILKKKEDEEIKKKDLNSNNCDIYIIEK